tara:strand:- start:617 stop:1156 length:540 start_codon:yes stop_codon:yes gene_type:complete
MRREIWIFGLLLLIVAFFFDSEILKAISVIKLDSIITEAKFASTFVLGAAVLTYAFMLKEKKKIFLLGIGVILAYIISVLIKFVVMRERPESALYDEVGYSFPSSHATVAFSTIVFMNKEFPKLKWIFIVVAVLIAFSRVYLSVHYASDIIAGGFLGYGVGLLILHRNVVLTKIKTMIK